MPSGDKEADRRWAIQYINQHFGWFNASPDATEKNQTITSQLLPVNYGDDWRTKFPVFIDDPRLDPDDNPPAALAPVNPVFVAMSSVTPEHATMGSADSVTASATGSGPHLMAAHAVKMSTVVHHDPQQTSIAASAHSSRPEHDILTAQAVHIQ